MWIYISLAVTTCLVNLLLTIIALVDRDPQKDPHWWPGKRSQVLYSSTSFLCAVICWLCHFSVLNDAQSMPSGVCGPIAHLLWDYPDAAEQTHLLLMSIVFMSYAMACLTYGCELIYLLAPHSIARLFSPVRNRRPWIRLFVWTVGVALMRLALINLKLETSPYLGCFGFIVEAEYIRILLPMLPLLLFGFLAAAILVLMLTQACIFFWQRMAGKVKRCQVLWQILLIYGLSLGTLIPSFGVCAVGYLYYRNRGKMLIVGLYMCWGTMAIISTCTLVLFEDNRCALKRWILCGKKRKKITKMVSAG